jgi:uncharacterized protein DUF2188
VVRLAGAVNQEGEAPWAGKTHHVLPNPEGGWDFKKGGGKRAIKHFDRQQDAIDYGRPISQRQHSEFYIHKKDGTIGKKDSHGHDPKSVPG